MHLIVAFELHLLVCTDSTVLVRFLEFMCFLGANAHVFRALFVAGRQLPIKKKKEEGGRRRGEERRGDPTVAYVANTRQLSPLATICDRAFSDVLTLVVYPLQAVRHAYQDQ